MKITSIAKGKVVKEEEREFSFSHHTLNQIEEHICNSEDSSYSTAQLIHDVVSYDPSTANNAQLADDMRICFAWYSTIKEGFSDVKERVKKFKFSEHDVVHLAKVIYSEIEKRKREGKMKHEWNVENMKKHSKELFDIISKGQSLQILPLTKENEVVNSNVSTEVLDSKDQGCGKAWEVLFAEGMAVQYFERAEDSRAFADEVNECSTNRGFSKDIIHVKYSWVHRHSKTKRCYPVNKKAVHYKCDDPEELEVHPGGMAVRTSQSPDDNMDNDMDNDMDNVMDNDMDNDMDNVMDNIVQFIKKEGTLPIHPGGTSDKYEPIELAEFLDKWNSFSIRKPFISLVGSLANWERTEGDIDILVKAHDPSPLLEALDRAILKCFQIGEEQMADVLIQTNQFIHADSLFLAAQWRIERAFPEWLGRLQILDDSFSGPFTNFVDLADLVAVSCEEKDRKEMAQMKKLKLFEFFQMLKPIHGRKKEEIYSIDSVIETIKSRKEDWFETGIYVEKKFDGCVTYSTLIDTDRGRMQIGDVVNNKLPAKVLSYNFQTSELEFKSIKTYWKNSTCTEWLKIVAGTNVLTCTRDHEIYSLQGKVQASSLSIDDSILLPTKTLDFYQEQIFIGTLLGDSILTKNEGLNTTPRMMMSHSVKQYAYASFKAEVLSNLNFSEKLYISGYGAKCVRFQSKTSASLSRFFSELFQNGRIIPDEIFMKITPLVLAVWYCDDGSILLSDKQRPRIYLYLNRYPLESVERVRAFFKTKFNLDSSIHEWKGYFLTFSADSTEDLISILKDFVHPSMSYKLNLKEDEVGSKLNFTIQPSPLVYHKIDSIIKVKTHSLHRYNIEVEDNHNYFAGGMLVGNCHAQAHVMNDYESGKVVRIFTEEGTKITKNCPTLRNELRKIPGEFILCGELELWKDGKHQPRAKCAGVLNSKEVHPDEKYLRFNIFDKLWHKGKDIHDLPFSERIVRLDSIANTDHVKKTKRVLCHSEAEVRKAIEKVSKEEGSEGAFLKKSDFLYELDGKTLNNIKYKLEISLDAVVLKKNKVAKTEKTFYYHCGLKSNSESVYCGKTFNTNIDAKEGDILKVVFVDISGYTDPTTKKRWLNWWAPRVLMLRTDKKVPDSVDTGWRMVKQTTGRFEEKKMPDIKNLEQLEFEMPMHKDCLNFDPKTEMCNLHHQRVDPDAPACQDFHPQTQLAAKGKRFDFKHHFRGASEHIDKRFQTNHVLGGFTAAAQHADLLKEVLSKHWKLEKSKDIYSLYWDDELAYQLDKKENITKEPSATLKKKIYDFHVSLHENPKYWKIDMETGEEKKRKGTVDDSKEVEKIFCVKKKPEPFEWLDVVGVTKPREIEPEPGGTRFYPGIFVPIDSGIYYSGAIKSYFHEYFLSGKKWKGRIVFRLVAGLKGTKAVANWLYWKPTDQSPYVLSSRAIRDNWLPDEGSAMSPEWEKKLPEELRFWKAADKKKKSELRKLAREYLKKKEMLSEESDGKFILTNRNWKGQYVVRGLPFEDYHLKINSKKFHLDKDPSSKMPEVGISALAFEGKEGYFKPGTKEPKTDVNPNLKIPAFIEVLDEGKVEIIADEPLYLNVRFKGEHLKGLYHLKRTSRQSEFWTLKKGMQSF